MKKRLILVAAPPAHGKNYVSKILCEALSSVAYFDKDDLAPLLSRSFALAGETADMDGDFYREKLRDAEYETLFTLAFSALRFSDTVLVNAPLSREVRDEEFMKVLRARAMALGASLSLVWVTASEAVVFERMKKRNASRDEKKLRSFAQYAKGINREPPRVLLSLGVLDQLIVFDNENEETAKKSLALALSALSENKE